MKQIEYLQRFLDQSKDPVWIVDLNFQLVYANEAYQNVIKEITGRRKEIHENVFLEELGKEDVENWRSFYKRAMSGENFEIEEQFRHPETGTIQYNQISFKPIREENGEVSGVACESRDITDLIKGRFEMNEVINSSLDVFCSVDENGRFIHVSAASREIWGYSPEELIGTKYIDLTLEEDIPKTQEIAAKIMDGNETRSFENRYKRKDGQIAYNIWSARWDPQLKVMYSVARDAREKMVKEEILAQSERRFKALVQEGSDLIAILDERGEYRYISPSSIKVLGMSPEEFVGRNTIDFIHPEDAQRVVDGIEKVKFEGKVKIDAFRFRNSSQGWIWLETVLTNLLDNPSVEGIVANSRDISEEKKLKKLSSQANKLAKVGSWEYDLVNDDLYWSQEVHNLHETDPDHFKPTVEKAIGLYKEEFKPYVEKCINRSISEGIYLDYEAVIVTLSKKERWIRVIGSPEFNDGKCIRFIGSFQDITERKEAESRLQSLADNLPGVAFQYIIHPDGKDELKYVTKQALQIWGISADEAVRDNQLVWDQIKQGGDFDKVQRSIQESVASKSHWNQKWNYVMPGGEIRTHIGYGSPKYLADGSVHFNSLIFDITDQIATERSFEQATSLAKVGTWEYDVVNKKLIMSQMIHDLFETDPKTFNPDLNLAINFFRADFREEAYEKLNNVIETGRQENFEAVLVSANNNERWVQVKGDAVIINGKCVKVYGSFQDIHDLKLAELNQLKLTDSLKKRTKDLEMMNEQLEQYAFIASHDLQEPLRMVTGFLDLLKRKYGSKLDEKAHEYIFYATDGAERMKNIISDLLEYSRVGTLNEPKEEVDLYSIINEYKALRSSLIEEKGAQIILESLVNVVVCKTPFVQTLHSLLDNAIKYSKKEVTPEIVVECQDQEEAWLISVSDNGIGVDPKFFEKIFVLFQRLHNRQKEDGTGIGLAVAKKHVNTWGGEIWLESMPGKGSVFYFTIPK